MSILSTFQLFKDQSLAYYLSHLKLGVEQLNEKKRFQFKYHNTETIGSYTLNEQWSEQVTKEYGSPIAIVHETYGEFELYHVIIAQNKRISVASVEKEEPCTCVCSFRGLSKYNFIPLSKAYEYDRISALKEATDSFLNLLKQENTYRLFAETGLWKVNYV